MRKRKDIPYLEIPSAVAKANTAEIDRKLSETNESITVLTSLAIT